MTPAQAKSSYRRALRERVTVRRYTSVGTNRTKIDVENVRARIVNYTSDELIGTIVQGDSEAILYADEVTAGGISDLTINDKIVAYGRELAIMSVDSKTIRIDGVLIAYRCQTRG